MQDRPSRPHAVDEIRALNNDPNRNINRMKVGQYYRVKQNCHQCGSLNINIAKREVFGKMTDAYVCVDCDAYYLDVNQLYTLQYGKR